MRYSEQRDPSETREENLREEIQDLRRQLDEMRRPSEDATHAGGPPEHLWVPSRITIAALVIGTLVILLLAFMAGYGPLQKRNLSIMAEASEQAHALRRVRAIRVERSAAQSDLRLPGNIEAITEAPILARAEGYIEKRNADIGDRVRAGQVLAAIDVPELDEQVKQAQASVDQARSGLDEALANLEQGRSDLELARLTSERWNSLVGRGAVSRQENDQYQTQYRSRIAGVNALEKSVSAQRNAVAAAEANVSRLEKLRGYRLVTAPFDGVITLRNVDVGALVNAGSTLLFRIAQTDKLRIYVNVPQNYANAVRPGQTATVSVSNLPERRFTGTVARTSNSLDPASRTLLTEVHVDNRAALLMPGMYAEVDLDSRTPDPPFTVPARALIVRNDGSQVALIRPDNTLHLQKIQIERDYGDRLDVTGGLREGDLIVGNPGDVMSEGLHVDPQIEGSSRQSVPSGASR
jgi:RND family efflux transporter MFP subunit